jgi:hypothetical protein
MAEKRSEKRAVKRKMGEENSEKVNTAGGAYVGGSVNTGGGDFVGRDKIVNLGALTQNIFAPVYHAIQESQRSSVEKIDLAAEVKEIEAQVAQGEPLDESFLSRRLRSLKRMAPDIAEVAFAALSGPGAAAGVLVKKIAEKVKAERD